MDWYRLAAKLGMSVQRCKQETTSGEFAMWRIRMADEANDFHRWDSYLAELCFQIYLLRKSFSGGKVEATADDFKFKFGPKAEKEQLSPEEIEERQRAAAEAQKSAILSQFGFSPDGSRVSGWHLRTRTPPPKPK